MSSQPATVDSAVLIEFLFRLGQAYLASGEQTAKVELTLRRAAVAYGIRNSRVVAFPTALFLTLHNGEHERVTVAEGPTQVLRLDQIAEVYELGDMAQRAAIEPNDGIKRLNALIAKPARFGAAGVIVGHTLLTVGLALVLTSSVKYLGVAACLGAIVGVLKVLNRDRPVLAVPLPVIAATVVSTLALLLVKWNFPLDPSHVLIPPLVAFLPGAMLTLGMVELVYGDMVSGSSRLITGFVQLVLLAFGLAAGAALVGVGPNSLVEYEGENIEFFWAPWIGVLVFGIGVYLHFSAPKASLPWMLLVMLAAFAAQRVTAGVFGKELSGFFGMLVATPISYLVQLRFHGPPAVVTILPSFWLLVPGSLGLLSVARMLSDRAAGLDGLTTAVFAIASIALGSLMGASLYKWLTERYDLWQLQIGRVGRYFRRKRPD